MDGVPCPVPRRIGIVHKRTSDEAAACANETAAWLHARGVEVVLDEAETGRSADLVLVLGGDGTLIHAAKLLAGRPAPILGVNMGSLGFLTEIPFAQLHSALELVLAGKAAASARMKLGVHVHRGGRPEALALDSEVLNDVVISRVATSPMVEVDVTAGGDYVTTYKADGIIVATPTGSTAYSLAVNGPILHPSMHGLILAPICPHTLTQRPIVLPDLMGVEIVLKSQGEVYVSIDGGAGVHIERSDRVQIKQSRNQVLIVRNPHLDYFGILRAKLRWGER